MILLSMHTNVLSAEDVGLRQSLLAEGIRGQPQQAQYRYIGVEHLLHWQRLHLAITLAGYGMCVDAVPRLCLSQGV